MTLVITHRIQFIHMRKKRFRKLLVRRCLAGSRANRTKLSNFRDHRQKRRIHHHRAIRNQISLSSFQYVPSFRTQNHYRKLWPTSHWPIRLWTSIQCAKKGHNYLKYCVGWLSDQEKSTNVPLCQTIYLGVQMVLYWSEHGFGFWLISVTLVRTVCSTTEIFNRHISNAFQRYRVPWWVFTKIIVCEAVNVSRISFVSGLDTSPSEIASYETCGMFFMPSFTSTSKTMPFEKKNTLMHIEISPEWPKFCMEILPEHTKYVHEDEILFSCYNLYRYQRTEKSDGQRIIRLQLLDYHKFFDYRRNTIRNVYSWRRLLPVQSKSQWHLFLISEKPLS